MDINAVKILLSLLTGLAFGYAFGVIHALADGDDGRSGATTNKTKDVAARGSAPRWAQIDPKTEDSGELNP